MSKVTAFRARTSRAHCVMPRSFRLYARRHRLVYHTRHQDREPRDQAEIWKVLPVTSPLKGFIFQLERCPETGTLHLQGYVKWDRKVTEARVFAVLGRCSILSCERSDAANIRYASKEDTRVEGPWVVGDIQSQQGKRTDLDMVQEAVISGATQHELLTEHYRGAARYWAHVLRLRNSLGRREERAPPTVRVYVGQPGIGKTRRAVYESQEGGGGYFIPLPNGPRDTPWFGEYDGQQPILVDDFNGQWSVDFFKRLTDRYPIDVPVKHGFVAVRSTLIIFTSNYDVDQWWPTISQVDLQAVMRRITVVKIDEPWTPPDDLSEEAPLSPVF